MANDLIESGFMFSSRAHQKVGKKLRNSNFRSKVDIIPIRFHMFKVHYDYNPGIQDYQISVPIRLFSRTLKLRFSRERATGNAKITMERFAKYKRVIARSPRDARKLENKLGRYLSSALGLAEVDHTESILQIFQVLQSADLDVPIEVQVVELIRRDTLESLHLHLDLDEGNYRAKLIPASNSFIQGLEEVRILDNPQLLGLECPVCMEVLAERKDIRVTKLPCSHYYHRDCIVPWLHINHVCPTCRRPNAPPRN